MAGVLQAADAFVAGCRGEASRTEVTIAMAEGSEAMRTTGQSSRALHRAQECIKFEYLGLACHVQKALALEQLGMMSESTQVLLTAKEIVVKLKERGNFEIARSAEGRGRVEMQQMGREGNDRVRMAQAWESWLTAALSNRSGAR